MELLQDRVGRRRSAGQRFHHCARFVAQSRSPMVFREGWPSKREGPSRNVKTSEVPIETLVIEHEERLHGTGVLALYWV